MQIMKKIISVLTAIFICGSSCIANAAVKKITMPTGWTVEYREPTADEQKNISGYIPSTDEMRNISIDSEIARSGKNSIKAVNTREKKQKYTYAEAGFNTGFDAGEYTLEFYAKGDFEPKGIEAGFGENANPKQGSLLLLNNSRYTKSEADENGWVKYSAQLKCAAGDKLHFRIDYACTDIYIDDVTVLKDGENILTNGGFEDLETIEISVPKGDDYHVSDSFSPDYPRMVYVHNMDKKVGVNWQNAESSGISKVGIYKVTDEEDEPIDESFSTTSGTWCSYVFAKENSEESGLYKLVTTFDDGRKTEYIISEVTNYKAKPTSWSADYNPGA